MEYWTFCPEDWVHFYPCQQSAMSVVIGLAGTSGGTSRGRVVSNRQTLISVKSINVGYAQEVYVNV